MKNYILFIQKYRKYLILLFFGMMIFAILGVTHLNINANFDVFKLADSEHQKLITDMEEVFGKSTQTLLMIESHNTIEGDLETVDKLLEEVLPNNYISPMTLLDLTEEGDLETKVSQLGPLSPVIFKDRMTYITYSLKVDGDFDFDILYSILDKNDFTYYLSGNGYMQYEILNMISIILMLIPPLALILVLLTFRSQLHSFKAAIFSVLPAGIAALWTLGLVGWFGGEVSIITVLAPIFSIVIGSADGLHFISHMEDESFKGQNNINSLIQTLTLVGMPMFITTTTSMAGFLGLLLIKTDAIRDLALFASVGILLAGLVTWYVLPLIFTGSTKLKSASHKDFNQQIKKAWGKPSFIGIVLLLLISITFIPRISTEFNQLMFFKQSNPVQKNFEKIFDINGGAIPLYYFGNTTFDKREETIIALDNMLTELEKENTVVKVMNPLSMVGNMETPSLTLLNQAKEFIRINNNSIYYKIMIFPRDLKNDTLKKIVSQIETYDGVDGKLVGMQFLMKELNISMISGQVKSIFFTLFLIIIMLIISLRSMKLTLIACLPIVLTSIILYGFLGLTQISLNVTTATIFSISLGIGVDYAIHYIAIYKYYKDHNQQYAREEALKYSSRPILANAFGLSLGMTALWLSPLLIHQHISSLMWVAMMTSVGISLTLIPTLLKD
ncbi:MAG: MMPL family transporter [Clostridiales bacterium]|nr:MMPL family transporter [Clostridiales bacterium]